MARSGKIPAMNNPLVANPILRTLLAVFALLVTPIAHAFRVYEVNTTADLIDDGLSITACHTTAGTCSLRAAIMKANLLDDWVFIIVPEGVYKLTIAPSGGNGDDTGELNLTAPSPGQQVSILGAGADRTIIDGNHQDSVFTISPGRIVYISGVTIRKGVSYTSGGGIRNIGNLEISDSAITDNTSNDNGGGIYNLGTLRVARTLIDGNFAFLNGGGIYNWGTLYTVNDTLSGNSSVGDGGGVYSDGQAFLYSTSIIGNVADVDGDTTGKGGGVFAFATFSSARFVVVNTLVAGNIVNLSSVSNCTGALELYGFNRFGGVAAADQCFAGGNGLAAIGAVSLFSIDTLQDNGGPTPTHALLSGSEAIDSTTAQGCIDENGAALTTDQRGKLRVAGARCDVGAFEYDSVFDLIFRNGFD
jgi:hypothetical protein